MASSLKHRTVSKAGNFLVNVLGIKLQEPEPIREDFPGEPDEVFYEQQPTTAEFLREFVPSGDDLLHYLTSLFPFLSWIGHYNLQWFLGDLVAGITIGAVVVPQGMAYAKLATLDVQFGLYSSFMGHLLYWLFATSKDVSIGPVAVMSIMTGRVVQDLKADYPDLPPHMIASALGIVAGCVVIALGLARCGWIIDLIPLVSLSAFVTGSALTIGFNQLRPLLGVTGVSTRNAPYRVFIDTMEGLPRAHPLDVAVGLSSLFLLYFLRWVCGFIGKQYPRRQRLAFFASSLRTVFVILLYTMVSWLTNMRHASEPSFDIVKTVPAGFQNAGVPVITGDMIGKLVGYVPATVVVLLLEHIAVAKSFGRINNYVINPSQEMVAIGMTNILGPFLGAFPTTGSFSRTAIQSKAGSRSPACGLVTAMVVLLAIYCLPPVFYYIPNATLAAVIIHAVGDLLLHPNTVYQFWRISPIEVFIYFLGVFITVFSDIENGIYATACISVAILLFRILKAKGDFLGKVRIHSVLGGRVIGDDHRQVLSDYKSPGSSSLSLSQFPSISSPSSTAALTPAAATRNIFLPIGHRDGSNPAIGAENPYPGIFIYRFSEGFSFPNASHTLAHLAEYIMAHTRRATHDSYAKPGDRPWNDPGTKKTRRSGEGDEDDESQRRDRHLPTLKAVILDFSSVNNIDITAVQQLVDVRNQLDRHAAPGVVDWHMACINNRWAKRALVAGGFGYPTARPGPDGLNHRWQSIFSMAEIDGNGPSAGRGDAGFRASEVVDQSAAEKSHHHHMQQHVVQMNMPRGAAGGASTPSGDATEADEVETKTEFVEEVKMASVTHVESRRVAVNGLNRPLFHVDLTSALQSAIANAEAAPEYYQPPPSPTSV